MKTNITIGAVLMFLCLPATAHACATLSPGRAKAQQSVRVANESAIIVWEQKTHIEHFFRTATFDTSSPSIGFLVPTPTVPDMGVADPGMLTILERTLEPKVVGRAVKGIKWVWWPTRMTMSHHSKADRHSDEPVVLSEQRVAGLDATTLAASDTAGLGRWLVRHGFAWNGDLDQWLTPYVAKHWKINAFIYEAGDSTPGAIHSQLLRMTFETDTPFFPYSEPASSRHPYAPKGKRLLRVFLLSAARMSGALGPNAQGVVWPGRSTYSAPLQPETASSFIDPLGLDAEALPSGTWMTSFEDASSPRPGVADLMFSKSPDQSQIVPSPIDDPYTEGPEIMVEVMPIFYGLLPQLLYLFRRKSNWFSRFVLASGMIVAGIGIGSLLSYALLIFGGIGMLLYLPMMIAGAVQGYRLHRTLSARFSR